ncbi:MAG: DUF1116 domain-containing protein [Bacillota bacterium]
MALNSNLIGGPVKVINLGLDSFANDLISLGVETLHVDWRPPANGDVRLIQMLSRLEEQAEVIHEANEKAIRQVLEAQPKLIDVGLAKEVIPSFDDKTILHAGPPIAWENMCGPMRGAIVGALIYEGLAKDARGAEEMLSRGDIKLAPCHDFGAVGPMCGVISASMPVFVVENENDGNRAYSNLNEGLGKVLRFGANSPDVIERLRWIKNVLAPVLGKAIRDSGGLDLKTLTAKALQMGDECHNRNLAATSLFIRTLLPCLTKQASPGELEQVSNFLACNDHFFLNLSMAACKVGLDAANGFKGSTLVTAMARNGVEFGIKVSGLPGEWLTAPAPFIDGLYFPGYCANDANRDLGDSAITETFGIGGFAMATAPAIVQFVGGTTQDALNYTTEMYNITMAANPAYTLPALDFKPTPTGIDVRKVVETGISPVINTGIAHREAGVGQVGAGIVRAPMECFEQALQRLAETIRLSNQ